MTYFGKGESVEVCQMLDPDSGKPDYPCSFVIHAVDVQDVVAAETIIEEIKAAIKLARQWNRELLTVQETQ